MHGNKKVLRRSSANAFLVHRVPDLRRKQIDRSFLEQMSDAICHARRFSCSGFVRLIKIQPLKNLIKTCKFTFHLLQLPLKIAPHFVNCLYSLGDFFSSPRGIFTRFFVVHVMMLTTWVRMSSTSFYKLLM